MGKSWQERARRPMRPIAALSAPVLVCPDAGFAVVWSGGPLGRPWQCRELATEVRIGEPVTRIEDAARAGARWARKRAKSLGRESAA